MDRYVTKKFTSMLSAIMLCKMVSSKSLNVLAENNNSATNFTKKAIEMKLIKKKKLSLKYNGIKRECTYYVPTKNGINYIWENGEEWNDVISSTDDHHPSVFRPGEYVKPTVERMLATASAIILCGKAGAEIEFDNFLTKADSSEVKETNDEESESLEDIFDDWNEDSDDITTFKGFLQSAMESNLWKSANPFTKSYDNNERIVFHGSKDLKENASVVGISHSGYDYAFSRAKGVVDSDWKTGLIFVAPQFYMRWNKFNTKSEIGALNMWKVNRAFAPKEKLSKSGSIGFLIVECARDFYNLFTNKYDKRNPDSDFGNSFDKMYIIPNNDIGVNQLRWIMLSDDEEEINDFAEEAVRSGQFTKNQYPSKPEFKILDADGNEVAIGFHLDGRFIVRMKELSTKNSKRKYFIMCYKWQEEYYNRVLPENVQYYTVE
jgi:hypothetical protein